MTDEKQEPEKVALTDAEKKSLHPAAGDWAGFYAAVERIVADRVAEAVERERAAWAGKVRALLTADDTKESDSYAT